MSVRLGALRRKAFVFFLRAWPASTLPIDDELPCDRTPVTLVEAAITCGRSTIRVEVNAFVEPCPLQAAFLRWLETLQ